MDKSHRTLFLQILEFDQAGGGDISFRSDGGLISARFTRPDGSLEQFRGQAGPDTLTLWRDEEYIHLTERGSGRSADTFVLSQKAREEYRQAKQPWPARAAKTVFRGETAIRAIVGVIVGGILLALILRWLGL